METLNNIINVLIAWICANKEFVAALCFAPMVLVIDKLYRVVRNAVREAKEGTVFIVLFSVAVCGCFLWMLSYLLGHLLHHTGVLAAAAPAVYPLSQVLKNLAFSRNTIKAHLQDPQVDRDELLAMDGVLADLAKKMAAFLNEQSKEPVQLAAQSQQVVVLGKTICNKVAARMAMDEIMRIGKAATINHQRSKDGSAKKQKWADRLEELRSEYRLALAFYKNPNTPEL